MQEKYTILKKYFGHNVFRGGQETVVDHLLNREDVLCVMPTGAGKSICYQTPAMIFDGITLVISPLISLMHDQVMALVQTGIPAAYINGMLTPSQCGQVLRNMACGKYKLIYVAPERLENPEFLAACAHASVSFVAVDEAHCVSQWGQDFRPGYRRIADFIDRLPSRPVVGAFTATATDAVKADIISLLKLHEPFCITTGFDRPNLYFGVERPDSKAEWLTNWLEKHEEKSGIVYCSTRKTVDELYEMLSVRRYPVTRYHAGLSESERKINQEDFVFDRKRVIIATNAFGMGIDKSDVSYVIHYNMPKSIENYYQEAGRAGRDGEKADCILLYAPQDVVTARFLILHSGDEAELSADEIRELHSRDLEKLKQMAFYCTTDDCLRHFILRYFGEKNASDCGNCSSCLTEKTLTDITVDAQKVLCCIARTGQRYGKTVIVGILRGSIAERITPEMRNQSTYGIMKQYRAHSIRRMIEQLEQQGFLASEGEEYPILKLTEQSLSVLHGETAVFMSETLKMKKKETLREEPVNDSLLAVLKRLRYKIAAAQKVPAYMIFSDATLADVCRTMPKTREDFLAISGIGQTKYARYGKPFAEAIEKWKSENEEN